MTPTLTLGILVLLAQPPPGGGTTVRYKVTLEYRGVWGLVTEASGTCPGVPPGLDTITGIVEGVEPVGSGPPPGSAPGAPPGYPPCSGVPCRPLRGETEEETDEGVEYTGVFTRTTEVGLCEVKDTPNGTEWCAGHLSGGGPFKVTIQVPAFDHDNEQTRFKLEPQGMGVWATVSGSCSSLDNASVAADYRSEDSIYFETANASGTRLMPTGRLAGGSYVQSVTTPSELGEYTLKVEQVP
jgi:hypothetical protein